MNSKDEDEAFENEMAAHPWGYGQRRSVSNEVRTMEYIKDRLNHEIRELTRQNAGLKEALFRKDKEYIDLQMRLNESDEAVNTLSVILGVTLLLLIGVTIAAIRHWGGIP